MFYYHKIDIYKYIISDSNLSKQVHKHKPFMVLFTIEMYAARNMQT